MRKLFIQFYLLLIGCFLTAVVLVGSIYEQAVDKVGDRYLTDLLSTSLSLIKTELKGVAPERWQATLAATDHPLSFPVKIERIGNYSLGQTELDELAAGNIVMLEDDSLFLQSLPDPGYVLVAGPLRYLLFLHQLKWLDYALIAFIALSLAVPVFLWMYPHWRDLNALENAARRMAHDRQDAHVSLRPRSGVWRLGQAFNRMVDHINTLLASKKMLTDAVAHELRTPLARLRYRLALLDGDSQSKVYRAMEQDLDQIDALIDELLLHARLDQPQHQIQNQALDTVPWLRMHMNDIQALAPDLAWQLAADAHTPIQIEADPHLLGRALDNLLVNASRHAHGQIRVQLQARADSWTLMVEDDGPGIAKADRERVFEPFVRLDASRSRHTGGHGLGLAITAGIAKAHGGQIHIDSSVLGGARFNLSWPRNGKLQMVTKRHQSHTDDISLSP